MNKPWIGILASLLILAAGILEWSGGRPALGIFLIVMAVVSFALRMYFLRKIGNHKNN